MIFLQSSKIAGTRGGNKFVGFFRTFWTLSSSRAPGPQIIDKKGSKNQVPAIYPVFEA